jgi:hypothetical protein
VDLLWIYRSREFSKVFFGDTELKGFGIWIVSLAAIWWDWEDTVLGHRTLSCQSFSIEIWWLEKMMDFRKCLASFGLSERETLCLQQFVTPEVRMSNFSRIQWSFKSVSSVSCGGNAFVSGGHIHCVYWNQVRFGVNWKVG